MKFHVLIAVQSENNNKKSIKTPDENIFNARFLLNGKKNGRYRIVNRRKEKSRKNAYLITFTVRSKCMKEGQRGQTTVSSLKFTHTHKHSRVITETKRKVFI